jgi:hypothetical protein
MNTEDFDAQALGVFTSEWQLQRGTGRPLRVAVIDDRPDEQYLYPEFILAQQLLRKNGIDAVIGDASALEYKAGKLLLDGQEIDLVYNRLVDFTLGDPGHAALATAYQGGAVARARHGVRVFNMSLNILQPAAPDRYSPHAARLDQIAESNNAVVFISAGNIQPQDLRAEWPADPTAALANLVNARNDGLLTPAESARNVTVAALNPPGHDGCIPFAPTRFSRRGPGLRSGVKPDLAHIGGAGSQHSVVGHGLFSILPDGTMVDGCGTSYASPLVAKTAAVLDHAIEGEVSRETLIGLLVHHAEMPVPLQAPALSPIARHMVGFGMPTSADRILETGDHSITLVFASRIRRNQQINFRFLWPSSLVGPGGKCRGRAKLTLVSTPPLDARFGSEFVRVNIDATLQQEQSGGRWKGRLEPLYLPTKRETPAVEAELIEHDLKWSPVKVLAKTFPQGVGPSSNWRLFVDYLTRAGEVMPEEGVPFTAIVTISDPDHEQPVFNDMRQNLQALGTQIADIRIAARITPRVCDGDSRQSTFRPNSRQSRPESGVCRRGSSRCSRCLRGVLRQDEVGIAFALGSLLSDF